MRHPTDGTLRRLLDEPSGVADTDREHVAGCPACRSGLAAARRDASLSRAALDVDATVDVDAGWSRLSRSVAADSRRGRAATAAPRWRAALRRPAVAAVAVVAVLGAASAAAAADWLQIYRTERIAPVTLSQADLIALPDLSAYGPVEVTEPRVRAVADAAAAQKATGLAVPRVRDLPRGVTGEPAFQVGDRVTAEFTFSAAQAARTAAAAGRTLPAPPPGLDGSTFRLTAGPGLAAVWREARGVPALIVARGVAPTAYSEGIPFRTAADYLLSLPGLPAAVAAQLRGFTGDGTTLPLPVNSQYLTSATADVGGRPATVLKSRDGLVAGVVWVDDGVVTAVAGSLGPDEVLSVARGLGER
ncbi:hypothetical protein GCM10020358_37300 [Amorphoplanes nipponensis]|uniref:Uncharacterized protein n=1 Tax=Actinoplanes nipponensis TaxID=135950 RepID=A0A919MXZ1_9ACTN|nr:hypothetical protein [Actinoplanes nipponensis]GIE53900.1 hypothetical protein Ani05nite_74340 [Actinoplanes nipponensis]